MSFCETNWKDSLKKSIENIERSKRFQALDLNIFNNILLNGRCKKLEVFVIRLIRLIRASFVHRRGCR